MTTLYITGNGFDLHHGIPCKYADFKKYCEEQDEEMAKRLETREVMALYKKIKKVICLVSNISLEKIP